ncbi:MAG: acyl-CoA dehydrogenase family protein [Acidimicrobiales bacterium]
MRLELTDDEEAVRDVFAGFFEQESSIEVVRAAEPGGFDGDLWAKLAQTGAPGMAVDTSVGGGGATLADLAIVATEAGRRLAPLPFVEHAVATRAIARLAPNDPALGELVSGDRVATIALRPAVDGVARLVPGGSAASVVMALDGAELVLIEGAPPPGPANTGHAPLADRPLSDPSRRVVGTESDFATALAEWQALTASSLVGLGHQALAVGVEYVMDREQFGVPVGSFQAVQHGLASASLGLEGAEYLAHKAIWALGAGIDDAPNLASMAFLFASESAQAAAAASLQYHGGYGYSDEYDIQLYFRRSKSMTLVLGDPGVEIQTLADRLLGPRQGEVA